MGTDDNVYLMRRQVWAFELRGVLGAGKRPRISEPFSITIGSRCLSQKPTSRTRTEAACRRYGHTGASHVE